MHELRKPYWLIALRVLRYIKGTPGQELVLPSENNLRLQAYCDSDWAVVELPDNQFLGYALSRSSAEAEYRAMANTCLELTWVRYILQDLKVPLSEPALLYCDNQAALHIAANPVFHERTKHIEIDCHIVREKLQAGLIKPCYVSTKMQFVDIFTKTLGRRRFNFLKDKLGVIDRRSPT